MGVNVLVLVGVDVTVAVSAEKVKVGDADTSIVPSWVGVAVGFFWDRTRLAFHNNSNPRQ